MHLKTALLCTSSFPGMNTDVSHAVTICIAAVVHLLRSLCWHRSGPMGGAFAAFLAVPRAEHPHWWCQMCQLGAYHQPKTQRVIEPAVELRGTRVTTGFWAVHVIFLMTVS